MGGVINFDTTSTLHPPHPSDDKHHQHGKHPDGCMHDGLKMPDQCVIIILMAGALMTFL